MGEALRSALNAVVFRSDDAALTTAGTYMEMVARVLGPILLALAHFPCETASNGDGERPHGRSG